MAAQGFDGRYPALYQPGYQEQLEPPEQQEPAEPPTAHSPRELPAPRHDTATPPARELPPPSAVAAEGGDGVGPLSPRDWALGLGAVGLCLLAALTAVMLQYWLPSSLLVDPTRLEALIAVPWGALLVTAAPPLLTAGMALLLALLLLASRRDPGRERLWRRAAGLGVGVVLGAAMLTVVLPHRWRASFTLEQFNGLTVPVGAGSATSWSNVLPMATEVLLVLGLCALLALRVLRPLGDAGVGGTAAPWCSAAAAAGVGAVYLVMGAVALFAGRVFAAQMVPERLSYDDGNAYTLLPPWPSLLVPLAPCFLLVGVLGLACAVWLRIARPNGSTRPAGAGRP